MLYYPPIFDQISNRRGARLSETYLSSLGSHLGRYEPASKSLTKGPTEGTRFENQSVEFRASTLQRLWSVLRNRVPAAEKVSVTDDNLVTPAHCEGSAC
jgi:hypothetical protein